MKNFFKRSAVLGLIALAGACASLEASADIGAFGGGDFAWTHPSGGATPNHIWRMGDGWSQTFAGGGADPVGGMTLHLFFDDNTLSNSPVDLDVFLNGVDVGSFSISHGMTGLVNEGFSFAPVSGPNYFVSIVETNDVPPGMGSISLLADGRSSTVCLEPVPEPETYGLMALGLTGLGLAARRRIART